MKPGGPRTCPAPTEHSKTMSVKTSLLFCLFAAAMCAPAVNSQRTARTQAGNSSAGVFDVRAFGARGDGHVLDTPAVNRAIEAAAAAGGGTVLFPAGTYLCFSIRLKS